MTFIATLIGLLIERFFDWSHIRRWLGYDTWQKIIKERFSTLPPYGSLAAILLPPTFIVLLLDLVARGYWYDFPRLLFMLVILLYCLGPRNLWADAFACINAITHADTALANEKLKTTFGIVTTDAREQQQQLVQAIFLAANNRVFAPVFWFCLLGPAGVVLYRLLTLAQKDNAPYAANLLAIADWLPIRILTFIFALGGHFVLVFSCWKHKVFQNRSFNTELLMECGQAALSLPENKKHEEIPAKETIGLLDRSFIIFLVIIAFFVLVTGK